ncbi:hypothetical protein M0358_000821 [Vibrio fluvialis]|nr:hypothetical protein [Vibrio fluvialis]
MKDGILELIVKFAETEDPLEVGVTLVVDGFLVSGVVISKDNYMKHNKLTSLIEDGIKKALSSMEDEAPDPEDDGERNFIHLRDAKYFTPGQQPIPNNESIYCRIRLEKVSGFNIGVLSL